MLSYAADEVLVDCVVNLILMMKQEDKCQLVENVITYAIKYWEPDKKIVTKQDFDFMDRFARSAMDKFHPVGFPHRMSQGTGKETLLL